MPLHLVSDAPKVVCAAASVPLATAGAAQPVHSASKGSVAHRESNSEAFDAHFLSDAVQHGGMPIYGASGCVGNSPQAEHTRAHDERSCRSARSATLGTPVGRECAACGEGGSFQ